MTSLEFCYWLQGLIEVGQPKILYTDQIEIIKDHLKLVFEKKTPFRTGPVDLFDNTPLCVTVHEGSC